MGGFASPTIFKQLENANNGSSWGGAGPNHVNMTLTYAAGSKPSKLVYQQWTLASCNLAFEFKGLPLP